MGPEDNPADDVGTVCGGVWTCGCGSQHWILYGNGACLCPGCNCISTVIENRGVPESAHATDRLLMEIERQRAVLEQFSKDVCLAAYQGNPENIPCGHCYVCLAAAALKS